MYATVSNMRTKKILWGKKNNINKVKVKTEFSKSSAKNQMQTHVAINTHALTNTCHTNMHSLSATHTHTDTFYCSLLIARELPAVRDLRENTTPPVPLSFPHNQRETLSNRSPLFWHSYP